MSAMRYRRHTRQRDMAALMATANVRLSVIGFGCSDRSDDGYDHAYDHVACYLKTESLHGSAARFLIRCVNRNQYYTATKLNTPPQTKRSSEL